MKENSLGENPLLPASKYEAQTEIVVGRNQDNLNQVFSDDEDDKELKA